MDDDAFNTLCNIVASGNLICMTGAGISCRLPLQDGSGTAPDWLGLLRKIYDELSTEGIDESKKSDIEQLLLGKPTGEELLEAASILSEADPTVYNGLFRDAITRKRTKNASIKTPDWKELLSEIYRVMEPNITENANERIERLLNGKPLGEELIEAASLLSKITNVKTFNERFRNAIKIKENATSKVHEQLLDLHPRGILTFNYDTAHETALDKRGDTWNIILPTDEEKIVDLLRCQMKKPFLFKAHGTITSSVDSSTSSSDLLVLTRESYRALFVKHPEYRAMLEYIFTNFNLLIVGFGLSDPDFDLLLQNVFSVFGSPVQDHIVIMHKDEKSPRHITYRLRYGLHFLYVNDFEDIQRIIANSVSIPGSFLRKLIDECLSSNNSERGIAHDKIRKLSEPGKKCLANVFENMIDELLIQESSVDYSSSVEMSELVYSYGVIAKGFRSEERYKNFLFRIIENSLDSEPVAHALVQVAEILEKSDLSMVNNWITRFQPNYFRQDPANPDSEKIGDYVKYIQALLQAKFRS